MASSPKNTASPGSAEEAPISFLPAGHWTGQGAVGDLVGWAVMGP